MNRRLVIPAVAVAVDDVDITSVVSFADFVDRSQRDLRHNADIEALDLSDWPSSLGNRVHVSRERMGNSQP